MRTYKLLRNNTLTEIKPGDVVTDISGVSYTVVGFTPPRQPNSNGMVTLATLRKGNRIELFPNVIHAHIATIEQAKQTFIITLLNSDNALDSITIAVNTDQQLLQALIEFVEQIEFFRDGDCIAITTPPWE